jgi:hypothetical protein
MGKYGGHSKKPRVGAAKILASISEINSSPAVLTPIDLTVPTHPLIDLTQRENLDCDLVLTWTKGLKGMALAAVQR